MAMERVEVTDPFPMLEATTVVRDEREHSAALAEAAMAELERTKPETDIAQAFMRESTAADAFSKLSRYETTVERSLYRALHELRDLRKAPTGQDHIGPVNPSPLEERGYRWHSALFVPTTESWGSARC